MGEPEFSTLALTFRLIPLKLLILALLKVQPNQSVGFRLPPL